MYRTGIADLPLHCGRAPAWLTIRMRKLANEIIKIMIDEQGTSIFLKRLSDPYWFQALGCVLGYDWHSSGVTTVLTSVLKHVLSPEEDGLAFCGGKGKTSRKTPAEIAEVGRKFGFSEEQIQRLTYTSKMTAKVDNTAIQAGYPLYHHAFLLTEEGKWAVIQQGMISEDRSARRYHWLSDATFSLVVEPHSAIVGDVKREKALNMTAKKSEGARKTSVDMTKEPPAKLMRLFNAARPLRQKSLQDWLPNSEAETWLRSIKALNMPNNINWETIKRVYEFQPKNY